LTVILPQLSSILRFAPGEVAEFAKVLGIYPAA